MNVIVNIHKQKRVCPAATFGLMVTALPESPAEATNEPTALRLNDGRLVIIFPNGLVQVYTKSMQYGCTFRISDGIETSNGLTTVVVNPLG